MILNSDRNLLERVKTGNKSGFKSCFYRLNEKKMKKLCDLG